MADFRFSLERLLQLRQRAKHEAALQTARAQTRLAEAEETRDATAASCDAARARMQPPADVAVQVATLRQASEVRDSLLQHLERSQAAVATRAQELRQRVAQLNTRTRDTRILERLEDRQREVWQVEAVRLEQLTMDDVARARFLRAQGDETDAGSTQ